MENPFKNYKPVKPKQTSERSEVIEELYIMYANEQKVEHWYRYKHWLKKKPNTEENRNKFKKAKLPKELKYYATITRKRFAIKLSHLKVPDLHYLRSRKNDFKARNGYKKSMFTKWLFFNIKCEKKNLL